jgi:thiamine pyrophosphate-dependent acetolactate synthase large subunit-like protein
MRVDRALAEILKREGVDTLIGYPLTPLIDAAAVAGIRPIVVRQERTGIHMADGISRVTSGRSVGVFAMQLGPGAENSFGAIAQAYSESVPIVLLPSGYPRPLATLPPNFSAYQNAHHITKWREYLMCADQAPHALRRAFTQVRNGRPRPALVELPADVLREELPGELDYRPSLATRYGPDPQAVDEAAALLVRARRPVIVAGQGVHYARAWTELRQLAELLGAPVATTLEGKSAIPEDHPLALGAAGKSRPAPVVEFVGDADLILGVGCSFSSTAYGLAMPSRTPVIQATVAVDDLAKDRPVVCGLIGDARITLQSLLQALRERGAGAADPSVPARIAASKARWLEQWRPKLESAEVPLSPYRVIRELWRTVDVRRTIITHDAGSPRDQLAPFWESRAPLTYLGWGKTTQLGYGLGLVMGAKLAKPDHLCVNVWGDAAIGMTGMDFETAVRARIPILSILFNNHAMACELADMAESTARYRSTDIGGNYAEFARALGGYGERIERPEEIVPAIQRGIRQTEAGTPALLEFITARETVISCAD